MSPSKIPIIHLPSVPLTWTLVRVGGADTLELAGAGGGVGGAGDGVVISLSGAGVDGSDLTSLLSSMYKLELS